MQKYWLKLPKPGEFRGEGAWVSVTKEVYDSYPDGFVPKHMGDAPPKEETPA